MVPVSPPMKRIGTVMVRCPNTGQAVSTGVEMDGATFANLPAIRARLLCPVCRQEHDWPVREGWLDSPAPSAPVLPWLFINNRGAPND
jgi:hypothetical protein